VLLTLNLVGATVRKGSNTVVANKTFRNLFGTPILSPLIIVPDMKTESMGTFAVSGHVTIKLLQASRLVYGTGKTDVLDIFVLRCVITFIDFIGITSQTWKSVFEKGSCIFVGLKPSHVYTCGFVAVHRVLRNHKQRGHGRIIAQLRKLWEQEEVGLFLQ